MVLFMLSLLFLPFAKGSYYMLTDEEFASLPPLNHLDRFSHCTGKKGGVYCTTQAGLVADKPNKIFDLIQNYSTASIRHYNYSLLYQGLCMTESCKDFYIGDTTEHLVLAAEACLNHTLNRDYGLKAKIEGVHCYYHNDPRTTAVDSFDKFALYVFIGLVALSVLGTLYDLIFAKDDSGFLMCFSLRGHWNHLKTPPPSEPTKASLVGLNGIRTITTILVMLGHAPIPYFIFVENPQYVEWAFENVLLGVLFQGHIITQTFFLISGFLLTYNVMFVSEKQKLTWSMLPKVIFIRWMRLLPVNLVVLIFTATWFRFTPLGPTWQANVGEEVHDCRQHWLQNLLYTNNYMDNSMCNLQNWSMAADMHLHILGLAVMVLAPSPKVRTRILTAILLIGMVLPMYELYMKDLDATFLATGTSLRNLRPFVSSPAFNHLYKRSHTNLPCFMMGMILGTYVYDWHTKGVDKTSLLYKVFQVLYWGFFPCLVLVTMSTTLLFLGDSHKAPLYVRLLFSVLQKPVFGLCIALIISGLALQIEKVPIYNRVLTWPLWTPLSKLTYSMFMVHVLVVRYLGATRATLNYFSLAHIVQDFIGVVILSTLIAFLVWMFVEAPFAQIVRKMLYPAKASGSSGQVDSKGSAVNGHAEINNNINTVKANVKSE